MCAPVFEDQRAVKSEGVGSALIIDKRYTEGSGKREADRDGCESRLRPSRLAGSFSPCLQPWCPRTHSLVHSIASSTLLHKISSKTWSSTEACFSCFARTSAGVGPG
eukprot:RCo055764